ncbi:MAG: hypothetical protein H8E34_01400 [Bacteroidetes bacterium]|nr:hypothetical protein [Bacteroidota bacterium]MBL6943091.1 hypothetical protein [Bacteroidales bacterium]
MTVRDNQQLYATLRNEYPFFEYQSYEFNLINGNLEAEFCFNLSDKYLFKPVIKIPAKSFYSLNSVSESDVNNFVFHIGMVELISYWKAACPPKVIIRPHNLDKKQVTWWKKLYFHGLGEFYYLNGICADSDSFMRISSHGMNVNLSSAKLDDNKVIVPIGGGKDSAVTIELLTKNKVPVIPMMVNPSEASIRTINTAGYIINQSIVINRTIDDKLLELNRLGFLNGHTPFSALLAFTGALTCLISGVGNIALSNESSANQSTVPSTNINHQYSKTFEFENDFAWYLKNYMHSHINYFSFLRPVNELQIAKIFSGYPQYFKITRSCNVGSKADNWCGKCSKCLFTYIILSPFIDRDKLIEIFGKDMLDDLSLKVIFDELIGFSAVKPFECVGTPDEVMAALWKYSEQYDDMPVLLKNIELENHYEIDFNSLISEFNTEQLIPERFEPILKNALND